MSAILEINAGAGGTEANDWAEMLMRMFLMYADKQGYKVTELNRQDGDVVGIKSIAFEFDGYYAFGMLKSYIGVHILLSVSHLNYQVIIFMLFVTFYVHMIYDYDLSTYVLVR